jgi:hypothetical protein
MWRVLLVRRNLGFDIFLPRFLLAKKHELTLRYFKGADDVSVNFVDGPGHSALKSAVV